MMFKNLAFALAAFGASATELTPDNYDELTVGKTVFIKFFAPWGGHCRAMKPAWDKLISDFSSSATLLVAKVDCTADGRPLCDANGIEGFPTLKYGDPADLQEYQGGRSYDDLKKFADENSKPICSMANIDLCDAEKKAEIEKFLGMDAATLEKLISAEEQKMEDAEAKFKDEYQKLQDRYQSLSEEKDAAISAVKDSGLGLMKSALKSKSDGDAKDEL